MTKAVKDTLGIATFVTATALFIALHSWTFVV